MVLDFKRYYGVEFLRDIIVLDFKRYYGVGFLNEIL